MASNQSNLFSCTPASSSSVPNFVSLVLIRKQWGCPGSACSSTQASFNGTVPYKENMAVSVAFRHTAVDQESERPGQPQVLLLLTWGSDSSSTAKFIIRVYSDIHLGTHVEPSNIIMTSPSFNGGASGWYTRLSSSPSNSEYGWIVESPSQQQHSQEHHILPRALKCNSDRGCPRGLLSTAVARAPDCNFLHSG